MYDVLRHGDARADEVGVRRVRRKRDVAVPAETGVVRPERVAAHAVAMQRPEHEHGGGDEKRDGEQQRGPAGDEHVPEYAGLCDAHKIIAGYAR